MRHQLVKQVSGLSVSSCESSDAGEITHMTTDFDDQPNNNLNIIQVEETQRDRSFTFYREDSFPHSTVPFERRQEIWKVMKKAIPIYAQEKKKKFAQDAEKAKLCILDAFQGRLSNGLANNSVKSKWIYTIFCIQTSETLFNTVLAACVFHTLSIFLEPTNACTNSVLYTALQVLILCIYAFDIGLKMSYEGVKARVYY